MEEEDKKDQALKNKQEKQKLLDEEEKSMDKSQAKRI